MAFFSHFNGNEQNEKCDSSNPKFRRSSPSQEDPIFGIYLHCMEWEGNGGQYHRHQQQILLFRPFSKIHIYEGKSLKNHRRSSLPSGRLIPKEEFSTSIVFNFCQSIDLMMFSISIISLFLLMPAIGVIAIRCRSCEGDTCNYNSIIINCDFGVNSCMRIYSTITGRS